METVNKMATQGPIGKRRKSKEPARSVRIKQFVALGVPRWPWQLQEVFTKTPIARSMRELASCPLRDHSRVFIRQ